ncbi:MAG: hypothetical protein V7731_12545 [Amphritea sp.]
MAQASYRSELDPQQQPVRLQQENGEFSGSGGVSQENAHLNFCPAFMDQVSGDIAISRLRNGKPAPFHSLDGLPDCWVIERNIAGRVVDIKSSIISGFVRMGRFFTCEEAVEFVEQGVYMKISFEC